MRKWVSDRWSKLRAFPKVPVIFKNHFPKVSSPQFLEDKHKEQSFTLQTEHHERESDWDIYLNYMAASLSAAMC